MDDYEIVSNRGHYEIYCNNIFIGSEDTYSEAEEVIEEHKSSQNPK